MWGGTLRPNSRQQAVSGGGPALKDEAEDKDKDKDNASGERRLDAGKRQTLHPKP